MQEQALFQVDHLQNHLSSSGRLSGDLGDVEGLRCKLFLQTRRTRSAIVLQLGKRREKGKRGEEERKKSSWGTSEMGRGCITALPG